MSRLNTCVFFFLCTNPHEFHGDQFESFFFETFNYLADQTALNAVRLDHDKGTFRISVTGHICIDCVNEEKNIEIYINLQYRIL